MSHHHFAGMGALVAACAVAFASPALAQSRPRSFEFGVFGGTRLFGTPSEGDSGVLGGTSDTEFFGLRLGYNFTPHWEIELTHDDVSTEDGDFGIVQRDYISDHLAVNYNFLTTTQRRVYPYVTGGLGRQVNKITVQSHRTEDTATVFVVGGGFRLFFNKSVALRVDGRFKTYAAEFDIPDANGPNPEVVIPDSTGMSNEPIVIDDRFTDFELTIGLYGIIGGKK